MVIVNVCLVGLFAKRWAIVCAALGIQAPFFCYFKAIWASQFAGQLGPTLVMAEGARYAMVHDYGGRWPTITSQIIDRLSGQLVLFGIILVLSPFYFSLSGINFEKWIWLVFVELLLLGLIGKCMYPRLCIKADLNRETLRDILNLRSSPGHYLISILIQTLLIANLGLAAFALNTEFDSFRFLLLAPLVFGALTFLPISISDWGTREMTTLLILSNLGMEAEQIVLFSLLFGLINFLSALPGGFSLIRSG